MIRPRAKVLVFIDWFSPGYKAGGPITSMVNFVAHLTKELEIFIFTSDRDLGDLEAYSGVSPDQWLDGGGCKVWYSSPGFRNYANILKTIRAIDPDVVYLNSMYSYDFSIKPLLAAVLGNLNCRIVLSPRGMLRPSALEHKSIKKKVFLQLIRASGIMRKVEFHATDEQEVSDIRKVFGKSKVVKVANLPGLPSAFVPPPPKASGFIKFIFVGRIHPIKNLDYLLAGLRDVKGAVELTIVGPLESAEYWERCQELISSFGNNISVRHVAEMPQQKVCDAIRNHHAFVLPTKGENFGHAIFEALAAGRPVLISDQTPWRNLELHGCGWDIALDDRDKFVKVLGFLTDMGQPEMDRICEAAWEYGQSFAKREEDVKAYIRLFNKKVE